MRWIIFALTLALPAGAFGYPTGLPSSPAGLVTNPAVADVTLNDDINLALGTSSDAILQYDTAEGNNTLKIGVGADSKTILVLDKADIDTDYSLAVSTNPKLCIASADETDVTETLCMYHDQSNAFITTPDLLKFDVNGSVHNDAVEAFFGSGADGSISYETVQTPDTMWIGVGDDSRHIVIGEKADRLVDYGLAQVTDPTLYIVSADQTALTDYIAFSHDQTDAVIDVGSGNLTTAATIQSTGNIIISKDKSFFAGDGLGEAGFQFDSAETNDTFKLTVGSDSRHLLISEIADVNTNFGVGAAVDPTLRIQSSDATATTDYVSMHHDQDDGNLTVGFGALNIIPANGELHIGDPADANGLIAIHTSTYEHAGAAGHGSLWVETDGLHYRYETESPVILDNSSIRSGFYASPGAASTDYIFGHYEAPAADADLTQASTTVTWGTANGSYATHAFIVPSGVGTCDSGCTICRLDVEGTTITDAGVRAATQTVTIASDVTGQSANDYQETSQKWIGLITYRLVPDAGNCSFTFNYGFAKYDDWGNRDFSITDLEFTGLAGANDSGFNIELLKHDPAAAWTYSAAAFAPGGTPLYSMNTDHNTEVNLVSGDPFAWKRASLNELISGADSEGFLVRVTTDAANAVVYMTAHIGAQTH